MTEIKEEIKETKEALLSINQKKKLFWVVTSILILWSILILYKLTKTEFQDTIETYNKTKVKHLYISDTTKVGVDRSFEIALQAWENTV
ncbi:MAG: hypothetical protein IPL35_02520 [Sphingobacteriales bacterium]|nr:hypothetical protein [Sphingobacteriales bacterium]